MRENIRRTPGELFAIAQARLQSDMEALHSTQARRELVQNPVAKIALGYMEWRREQDLRETQRYLGVLAQGHGFDMGQALLFEQ